MASIYQRKDSAFFWIRIKRADGKWIAKATEFRKDNPGDRRQAQLVARKLSIEERERTPATAHEGWDAWVDRWMQDRYGAREATTLTVYRRYWRRLREWLLSEQIHAPGQLTYQTALLYKARREKDRVSINTIIHELKFLGVVMGEAVRRGFAAANPCLRMGLQRKRPEGKLPWPMEAVTKVAAAIGAQPDWMQASFILGYYQAARLRQCEVPLRDIDLPRRRITYWRSLSGRPLMKGDRPFTQPIASAAVPMLARLIERRRMAGLASLCELPLLPSVEWRRFLDGLGLEGLCHHGLRTTWVTHAAQSGEISRAEAMRFVNHGSTAIHEIYQRLNADDVAHVADALNLPDLSPAKPRRAKSRSAT